MSSWEIFLERGSALASEVRSVLDGDAPGTSAAVLEPLTALEIDARLLGVNDLADVVGALRARIERLESRPVDEALLVALREAAAAIVEAFVELSRPDTSGAHLDTDRMTAVRRALVSDTPVATTKRPALRPAAAAEDDSRWEPTVDEDMIDPFLDECRERLEGLAERLVELERTPDDEELVRAIFRDLHTLKGSSAFVGLKRMTRLAHAAEDLVGQVRDGRRAADRPVVDSLLASLDGLSAIVLRASQRAAVDVDVEPLIARLHSGVGHGEAHAPRSAAADGGAPAAAPGGAAAAAAAARHQTLRIDFEKLDLLMNLVGELVISKGRLSVGMGGLASVNRELDDQRRHALALRDGSRRAAHTKRSSSVRSEDLATELGRLQRAFEQLSGDLESAAQQVDFVSGELRDQVMKLRMVPIGRTFSKYHRTVREIAHQLGKKVLLEVEGGDTELDKVLVEQLDDPLLHLVRNAIDHGIESPEVRASRGKAEEGHLRLAASHRGNQILIRISDDGGGIDVGKVRAKAIEKGLIPRDTAETLEDEQIFDLIFRPGFSTAGAVSDLSGRGVGMDVVRDTITRLKGTVAVASHMGTGSTFEIRVPLTLAIVQVLLLRAGGETYAVPIDLVERTVAAPPGAIRRSTTREVLYDGGHETPVVRLRDVLGLGGAAGAMGVDEPVVLVDIAGQRYGLVCDALLGRQEIVIKSLGSVLSRVPGAAGATLIGERCVLILDVPTLVAMSVSSRVPGQGLAGDSAIAVTDDAPHVLVVEDAEVVREAMRRILAQAGYRVTVARDGAEGLALAERERFDLVSTDVVMPNMDGYELTRRLRAMPEYADVPIVMVTSKEERIDRIRGFDAGVDAYLTKPADASELLRAVRRHLNT